MGKVYLPVSNHRDSVLTEAEEGLNHSRQKLKLRSFVTTIKKGYKSTDLFRGSNVSLVADGRLQRLTEFTVAKFRAHLSGAERHFRNRKEKTILGDSSGVCPTVIAVSAQFVSPVYQPSVGLANSF